MLLLFLLTCTVILLSLSFVCLTNNTVRTQQQQQQQLTSQGTTITIIPGLTQNVLTIVFFLIGISSFILGLRIQNAARITTESLNMNLQLVSLPAPIRSIFKAELLCSLSLLSITDSRQPFRIISTGQQTTGFRLICTFPRSRSN